MRLSLLPSCLLLLTSLGSGVYGSAGSGSINWHKPLIGRPLLSNSNVAPTFFHDGENEIVLSATSSNVFAALSSTDGDIAWRHVFDASDPILLFRPSKHGIALLNGVSGSTLRLFSPVTGNLIWERLLHQQNAGRLSEPAELGVDVSFATASSGPSGSHDLFVLTNGQTVRRLKAEDGTTLWEWTSPGHLSMTILTNIYASPETVTVYGLSKSFASHTVHVFILDAKTGETLVDIPVPSSIQSPSDLHLLNTATSSALVWLESGELKSFSLPLSSPQTLKSGKPKTKTVKLKARLVDQIELSDGGLLVVRGQDRPVEILTLNAEGDVVHHGLIIADVVTGSPFMNVIKKNLPTTAHLEKSDGKDSLQLVIRVLNSEGVDSDIWKFGFVPLVQGNILHATLSSSEKPHLFLTTSTGAVYFYAPSTDESNKALELQWIREESLSEIIAAEFVDLPEQKTLHSHLDNENFVARLIRHAKDLQNLPGFILHFVKRFSTGSYESLSSVPSPPFSSSSTPELVRDTFGFRKLLIAVTGTGKIFALDSVTGDIVWSRSPAPSPGKPVFGFGKAKLFVLKTTSEGGEPEIVVLLEKTVEDEKIQTVIFRFAALSGKLVAPIETAFNGSLKDAFLLRGKSEDSRTVVLVDEQLKIHIYPKTEHNIQNIHTLSSRLHFVLHSQSDSPQHRIVGYQPSYQPSANSNFTAVESWRVSFPPNEHVMSIVTKPHEIVASFGKVLGDKSTLYKYLNPNLLGIVTLTSPSPATPSTSTIYLIDAAKGTIIYRDVVEGAKDLKMTFTENWIVYHYFDDGSSLTEKDFTRAKGYRVVSVELYEGSEKNDIIRSSDLTSESDSTLKISAFEQSFVFPHGITALATTSTKFGITMKDIIVATNRNQIQSFPRRLLDPRRTQVKPTAEQLEEGLIIYDPVIPDDPKRVLSGSSHVFGTTSLLTSPTLLESTSLVLSFGTLDLFLSTISPSSTFDILSEGFNKVQLIMTIIALGVGIGVVRPIVRRKGLKARWY